MQITITRTHGYPDSYSYLY